MISFSPRWYWIGLVLGLVAWVSVSAEDWAYWRGPHYNGTSYETGLIDVWDPQGGPDGHVTWQRDDLGGRSTPVVWNGRLYTIVSAEPGTPREGERVVCVDAATGKQLWENRFNVWLSDVPDTRVGWSSCVADPETGNVYALGVCGYFLCMDGKTGRTLWSIPLHEQFGLLSTYGGRTNFPIVFEDLVIVSGVIIGWGDMAKPAHRLLAFDKRTGDVVWFGSTRLFPEDTTYSAPSLAAFNGVKALVLGSGDGGIWAFQPRTGLPIWNFDLSRRGVNVAPVVQDDVVFASHSEENLFGTAMGAVAAIDGTQLGDITESGEIWRVDEIMAGKNSPLYIDGRLYVFDERAKLHIFDAKTGKAIGRRMPFGTSIRACPLYADGKIYVVNASGQWFILKPDPRRGVSTVSQGPLLPGDEGHASPICANGRIYIQTSGRLYCLSDPSKKPGSLPSPEPRPEEPVSSDQVPAQLQIVPAEVLVKPGDSLRFTTRVFNSRGQLLPGIPVTFTRVGAGNISSDGEFQASSDPRFDAVTVTAQAKGLTGNARVRVIPPLPWRFDFEEVPLTSPGGVGEPPLPWIGCRYRHVVRKVDGNNVMVKVTTIPKGTRSRGWFGQTDLHDYTIQADVRGAVKDGKIPDIGLIAQGYALAMMGMNQQLELLTWDAVPRMDKSIAFEWKPDVWYTIKLRAENQGPRAVLRGKIWPKDQPEPANWTIEAQDEAPNRTGSPGLFGNASDAEIFLDNIQVTANVH